MMEVYKAVNTVQSALAKTGITKGRQASGGGANYAFRGIDDVYAHLAPLLAEHGLCVFPRCLTRDVSERSTRNGGALFVAVVHVEFDFVAMADGSKHTVSTFGEAMDSSDKATNKAMSAAFKYAAFMTFCIPTEGDNDTENNDHQPRNEPSPELLALIAKMDGIDNMPALTDFATAPETKAIRNKLLEDDALLFNKNWIARKQALCVDEGSVNVLCTLIDAAGITSQDFMDRYKIKKIVDLPIAEYSGAVEAMNEMAKGRTK